MHLATFGLRSIGAAVLLATVVGCGVSADPLEQPVSVVGKVVSSSGKPVGNMNVILQPLEQGYEKTVEVKPDGTFPLETHPGRYAYYFAPKKGTKKAPANVEKYRSASMDRTVEVRVGAELTIQVD